MSACREISKIHEESVRGTLDEVIAHFEEIPPKGEFVIVLAGRPEEKKDKKENRQKKERRGNRPAHAEDEEQGE